MVDISDEVFQKMANGKFKHIPISDLHRGDEVLIMDAKSGLHDILTITGCMVDRRKQNYITAYSRENGETNEDVFFQKDIAIICKMEKYQLLFPFM